MTNLLSFWYSKLNMPKYDEQWHRDDMAEYHEATGLIDTWSELSDVVYTYSRAKWSGHSTITFPFSRFKFLIGVVYMIPKYSLRWYFFRTLGRRIDPDLLISEVRNPNKLEKMKTIAEKYQIDPTIFKTEAEKLMRHWILLK